MTMTAKGPTTAATTTTTLLGVATAAAKKAALAALDHFMVHAAAGGLPVHPATEATLFKSMADDLRQHVLVPKWCCAELRLRRMVRCPRRHTRTLRSVVVRGRRVRAGRGGPTCGQPRMVWRRAAWVQVLAVLEAISMSRDARPPRPRACRVPHCELVGRLEGLQARGGLSSSSTPSCRDVRDGDDDDDGDAFVVVFSLERWREAVVLRKFRGSSAEVPLRPSHQHEGHTRLPLPPSPTSSHVSRHWRES